jgi:uncharacterized protein YyaL (SSP411 family)
VTHGGRAARGRTLPFAGALAVAATLACHAPRIREPKPAPSAAPTASAAPAASDPAADPTAAASAREESPMSTAQHTNRLAKETSPYLLQHAHNPVDWYPWGPEAFERAKREDKPVFLSIGYSACHWCHVMERESFEDEAIAKVMNDRFVCIKVDREERPDVDDVYMKAVQILTQGGGWPMSVWLTPEGKPFFGGTYFPPEDRYGRAGFPRVCEEMGRLWKDERKRVSDAADALTEEIKRGAAPTPRGNADALPGGLVARASELILQGFDEENGGFGGAPKFPHPMDLSLLLRVHARFGDERAKHAALFSLQKMAAGGMYDQVGGGFHRYSVDEHWLVPHFEKMLYDNAQLAGVYLDAFLATGDVEHARVVREILDYVLREMTAPEGGFYATQDADSEGEEGKYFVWDRKEIEGVLGDDMGAWVAQFFGVSDSGNFEHGKSVLSRPWTVADFAKAKSKDEAEVATGVGIARCKLFGERSKRVAPNRDDKVLADWNGLMISAFARAGFHLNEPKYLDAARKAGAFVRAKLWSDADGGKLLRSYKDGQAKHQANLADHAFLIAAFLDLYEAAFDPADLAFARRLADRAVAKFWDEKDGGFWFTADDHEALIARSKEAYDGALPSGPSVMIHDLLRLAEMTGEESYRGKARRTLALYQPLLERHPQAVARMMWAVDFLESRPREIVLSGDSDAALAPFLDVLRTGFDPNRVVVVITPDRVAALAKTTAVTEGREPVKGTVSAFVCRDGACKLPISDAMEFANELATGK